MWAKIALSLAILYCSGVESQLTIDDPIQRGKAGQSASISCTGLMDPFDQSMAFYKLNTNRKDDTTIHEQLTFWGQVEPRYQSDYRVEVGRSPLDSTQALYTITVNSLADTDDGYYMCAIVQQSSKVILDTIVAELVVLQPVQELTLKIGSYVFKSDHVNENIYKSDVFRPLMLTCEASGSNPKPNMQIKIGGTNVTKRAEDVDRVSVIGTFPNQARLHRYRLQLSLKESDVEKDIECIASVKGLAKKSKVAARVVVSKPPQFVCQNVSANVNDRRVKLSCTVTYNPRIHAGVWVNQKTQQKIDIGKATPDGYTASIKRVQANSLQTEFVLEIFQVKEHHFNTLFELQVRYSGKKINKVLRLTQSKTGASVDPADGSAQCIRVSALTLMAVVLSIATLVRHIIMQQ